MKRIGLKKESEIIRRLHYLLSSGHGIIEALSVLQKSHPFLSPVLASVRSGKSVNTSLKQMKAVFSPLTMKVVEVGELTGTLSSSLLNLSEHLRRSYEMRRKLINVFIYPFIIILLSFGLVTFLLAYTFPKILPIFKGMNLPLPVTTKVLIFISDSLSWQLVVLVAVTLFVIIFCFFKYMHRTREAMKKMMYRMPGLRRFFRLVFLVSFFRSMGMMLQSQVGIIQALFLMAESENYSCHRPIIQKLIEHVKSGRSVSSFLADNPRTFMSASFQFIEVGERTGSLGASCQRLSEYLEHDYLQILNRTLVAIEPAVMIIVGAVVGFISLSLISPLYEFSRISAV